MTDNAWLTYGEQCAKCGGGPGTIVGTYRNKLKATTPEITVFEVTQAYEYGRDADGKTYYRARDDDVWYPYTNDWRV